MYCATFIGFLFDIELTLRWPWRSSNTSMVWPHSTWPTTVFWPRLCAVDDICGPLTPWNWWCSGQRPSSAPGPLQLLLLLYGTDYQLTFELLRARFRHLHRNWKLFMLAGASEDFLFCAVEIDSLLLLLLTENRYEILRYSCSWSFKVIKIGTNRKPVCDFLLVLHCSHMSIF